MGSFGNAQQPQRASRVTPQGEESELRRSWVRPGTASLRHGLAALFGLVAVLLWLSACEVVADADGDGLADSVETNTGVFVDATNTGTDPNNPDTDNDGLRDGVEVDPAIVAYGVNPLRADVLVEFDWMDDDQSQMTNFPWYDPNGRDGCGSHSHRPSAAVISQLVAAFAAAPVSNPDGSTGITFIADYGQGGAFTGGNLVADADGLINGGVFDPEFLAHKAANFDPARAGLFHYALMPHRYLTENSNASSGNAWISGPDLIVSLYCFNSTNNVARTTMHELGHNFGLLHGGDSGTNLKPNYNSVMNYLYQFPGVDVDCNYVGGFVGRLGFGDGVLDYSTGSRAPLNEAALLETNGICNGVDVDWNLDGTISSGAVSVDINGPDGIIASHTDHNDWGNLNLAGVTAGTGAGAGARVGPPQSVEDQPVPAAFE